MQWVNRYSLHPRCLSAALLFNCQGSISPVRPSVCQSVSEGGRGSLHFLKPFRRGRRFFPSRGRWQPADLTHAYVKQFGPNRGLWAASRSSKFFILFKADMAGRPPDTTLPLLFRYPQKLKVMLLRRTEIYLDRPTVNLQISARAMER